MWIKVKEVDKRINPDDVLLINGMKFIRIDNLDIKEKKNDGRYDYFIEGIE